MNWALGLLIARTAVNVSSVLLCGTNARAEGGEVKCAFCLGELGYPNCRAGGCRGVGADYCYGRCVDCGCEPGYQALCSVRWDPN
ncbi:MAG: hypothetical protein QHJ34_09195 [bacterium]|jgi:hypothetical protein|nr:hypothetical protein [candidate division KSB1 bacterium]MDH7560391.1 hypothetical protein [bacterium]